MPWLLALVLLFTETLLTGERAEILRLKAEATHRAEKGEGTQGEAAQSPDLLWYRTPAAGWNEALPIGNGRLGAMVFGGVREERLQLNEDSVWAGQKLDRINPAAAAAVP
jgi:alpha-L-fucosidase 2